MEEPKLVLRRNKEKHPLYVEKNVKSGTFHRDPKTHVNMRAMNQPFQSLGAGRTRGVGMQLLERHPARKIIVISEQPLMKMDLENFTVDEYKANKWYIFNNDCAMRPNDWSMLANTKAPKNARGEIEESNARLVVRSLPKKKGQNENYPHGTFVYIVSTKVINVLDFVILDRYGKGPHCLLWGQDNTIKKQIVNMIRYETSLAAIEAVGQKAVFPCDYCGMPLPHGKDKKKAHRFVCKQNKVHGMVVRR